MTPATFRAQFTEFADPALYTDIQINFYSTIAGLRLNADRWSSLLDFGTSLFIAHYLTIDARNKKTANSGGLPGEVKGPVTQKQVSKASASYDAKSVSLSDQGFWGMSMYGIQFLQLAEDFGAGGIQLGVSVLGPATGFGFPWPPA